MLIKRPIAGRYAFLITGQGASTVGRWPLWFGLLVVLLSPGCRFARTAVDAPAQAIRAATPGNQNKKEVDLGAVEERLLRLSDELSAEMVRPVEMLRH